MHGRRSKCSHRNGGRHLVNAGEAVQEVIARAEQLERHLTLVNGHVIGLQKNIRQFKSVQKSKLTAVAYLVSIVLDLYLTRVLMRELATS